MLLADPYERVSLTRQSVSAHSAFCGGLSAGGNLRSAVRDSTPVWKTARTRAHTHTHRLCICECARFL